MIYVRANQSLADAAKLISNNFTDRQRQFAGSLVANLDERINQRRVIARGGNPSAGISKKTERLINAGIFGAVAVTTGIATAATAGIAAPVMVGLAATGSAVATGGVGLTFKKLVKVIPKRKIKRSAEIYNNYLPEENKGIIKLFSQLVSLSMAEKLQTVLILQEKSSVLSPVLKRVDNAIDQVARVRKISRQNEKNAISTLVNAEFDEIWAIFKEFMRDKGTYASFKETALAKQITDLFAGHCDLGDATDRSEIVNAWEVNSLWINVFSRYLEGKDAAVRESVLSTLESKLNVMSEVSFSPSLSSQCSLSSGIGSSDSLASQAGIVYAPRLFAPQAATETLVANQPEHHLSPGIRL